MEREPERLHESRVVNVRVLCGLDGAYGQGRLLYHGPLNESLIEESSYSGIGNVGCTVKNLKFTKVGKVDRDDAEAMCKIFVRGPAQ